MSKLLLEASAGSWTHIASAEAEAAAAGTTLDCSTSLNVAAGDLLVAWCKHEGANGTFAVAKSTGSPANTFTFDAADEENHSNGDLNGSFGYVLSAAADATATFRLTTASRTFRAIVVYQFRPGAGTSVAKAVAGEGQGTGTLRESANVVVPSGAVVVFGGHAQYADVTLSNREINDVAADAFQDVAATDCSLWYRIVSSGFTGSADVTSGTSSAWICNVIAFSSTGSGGGDALLLEDGFFLLLDEVASEISGALDQPLNVLTLSSAGTADVAGVVSKTLGAVTSSSAGTVAIDGASAKTFATVSLASAGGIDIQGVTAKTLAAATMAADGLVSDPFLAGELAQTFAPLGVFSAYPLAVLDSDPIGYWRLGDVSGTVAVDHSIYHRNGEYVGGVALGHVGVLSDPAALFDGSSGYVNIDDTNNLRPTAGVSVSVWIKPSNVDQAISYIGGTGGTGNYGYALWVTGATGRITFTIGNGVEDARAESVTELTNGRWYDVVGTYDGINVRLYIDGVLEATVPQTGLINYTGITRTVFGQLNVLIFDAYWSGALDEIAIYPTALTAEEIVALYAAGRISNGTALVSGDLAVLLGPLAPLTAEPLATLTLTAEGATAIDGGLVHSLTGLTSDVAGVVDNAGTLAGTLNPITTVFWIDALNWIQVDFVEQAPVVTGTVDVAAVLAGTLDAVVLESSGVGETRPEIVGEVTLTLAVLTVAASGTAEIPGTVSVALDSVTGTAAATVTVSGVLAAAFDPAIVVPISAWQPVARPGQRYSTRVSGSGTSTSTTITSSATSTVLREAA